MLQQWVEMDVGRVAVHGPVCNTYMHCTQMSNVLCISTLPPRLRNLFPVLFIGWMCYAARELPGHLFRSLELIAKYVARGLYGQ
jgi:hypothetical protein